MNIFKFIGTIPKNTENMLKIGTNNRKQLKFLVRQNENNAGYVQMYGDNLVNGCIPCYMKNGERKLIKYEERFNQEIINNVSYASKYVISGSNKEKQFIWKDDFIEYFMKLINAMPETTIYEVSGEFSITYSNNKQYNNFNLKSIKINNSARPELTLDLELFYNWEGLDESDKKNKFILNAFVEQYVYADKKKEYFPIQVEFITNRFDFKNMTDVEVIRHRKANINPKQEEGFVKARWECQYVRGAQLILPPLETLPENIQFEIKNAGRDLREYMNRIVGKASEYICLTRPNNTLNKNGDIYIPLNCTDNEFKSNINQIAQETQQIENTIDNMAEKEAILNPFN